MLCSTALVTILIQSAPPTANRDNITTAFNTDVIIPVLSNDVDKASRPANLSLVSLPVVNRQPQYGVATVNADGTITYNPLDTYAGTDTLIYRICDLVDPTLCDTARVIITIQSAPPTASPDFFNIGFNLSGTVQVLANDIDKAGRPANLTNVAAPQIIEPAFYGSASVNTDGTITYTPNSAFAGSDTIVYRICDNINPSLCDTTLAVFNVGSMAPNAVQDAATTPFNTSVTVNVLANDTDRTSNPASLTYITLPMLISLPANGSAVINPDGTISYTPTTGFAGLDTLRYQLCDRVDASLCDTTIVVFTVGSAAPTANPDVITVPFNTTVSINVLANDLDRNGQPATVGNVTTPVIITQPANATTVVRPNGTVVYDPLSAFAGPDTLVYRICDPVNPSLCDSALVIVLVGSAPPIANNDAVTVPFNTSVAINVLANDLDRAGLPASVSTVTVPSIIRLPSSGTTVVTPNGTVVYDPLDGVAGNDTLVYRICDRVDPTLCDSALVIISNLSTSPIAFPDAVTTAFNTSLTITVLGNDLVLGGQPASLSTVSLPTIFVQPANGTASVNPDGSFTYIPNTGFTGTDTFFYRICDLIDPTLCVTAQVTIQISTQECPDPPVCIPLVVKKIVR